MGHVDVLRVRRRHGPERAVLQCQHSWPRWRRRRRRPKRRWWCRRRSRSTRHIQWCYLCHPIKLIIGSLRRQSCAAKNAESIDKLGLDKLWAGGDLAKRAVVAWWVGVGGWVGGCHRAARYSDDLIGRSSLTLDGTTTCYTHEGRLDWTVVRWPDEPRKLLTWWVVARRAVDPPDFSLAVNHTRSCDCDILGVICPNHRRVPPRAHHNLVRRCAWREAVLVRTHVCARRVLTSVSRCSRESRVNATCMRLNGGSVQVRGNSA
jgi:hypothetical protein